MPPTPHRDKRLVSAWNAVRVALNELAAYKPADNEFSLHNSWRSWGAPLWRLSRNPAPGVGRMVNAPTLAPLTDDVNIVLLA